MKRRKTNWAVKLENITKTYTVFHGKPTLAENILKRGYKEKYVALNNINLRINQGEKVGIIGNNGAGKTTLLKIIAGIATPTIGKVSVKGKVVSLIDLEAGFHQELTGEENIYLSSFLHGMSKQEIRENMRKIKNFADIGTFIDAPFYTYSEGMKLRLGFSVAVHTNPDILILDESISAGDADFQKKSSHKIEKFIQDNKTIIIVTHWLEYLKKHCDRILYMENGKITKYRQRKTS